MVHPDKSLAGSHRPTSTASSLSPPSLIPWLMCLASLLVYFLSSSGTMFTVINDSPFVIRSYENPNLVSLFVKGSDSQLGAEGFIAGGLYLSAGVALAVATHAAPRIGSRLWQRVVVLACLTVLVYAAIEIRRLERWKIGAEWDEEQE